MRKIIFFLAFFSFVLGLNLIFPIESLAAYGEPGDWDSPAKNCIIPTPRPTQPETGGVVTGPVSDVFFLVLAGIFSALLLVYYVVTVRIKNDLLKSGVVYFLLVSVLNFLVCLLSENFWILLFQLAVSAGFLIWFVFYRKRSRVKFY